MFCGVPRTVGCSTRRMRPSGFSAAAAAAVPEPRRAGAASESGVGSLRLVWLMLRAKNSSLHATQNMAAHS